MKHLSSLITLLFVACSLTAINAQSKVAHIDTQKLISEMPEVIAAQAELEKLEKQYASELETSVKELQNKIQLYGGEAESQTDLTNQQRRQELESMQAGIQQFRENAAAELQKKTAEMMRPLYEKARAAIEKVSAAQAFDYVLDASPGGSVIIAKGKDLYTDVKKELGF